MRFKVMLASLLAAVSLIAWGAAPAQAATYASSFSELSFPSEANTSYQAVLSGRITPSAAGRPVSLYAGVAWDGSGGSWVAGTTVDGNGRFSFVVTVTSPTRYKFFSAKQVVGNNTYQGAGTNGYLVNPPSPQYHQSSYSELSFPARANNDYQVALSGRIWPAAAGRPVSLYTGVNADGSGGSWLMGAHTDGNGRFSFVTTVRSATRFKFFSARQTIGLTNYEPASTGAYLVSPPVEVTYDSAYMEMNTPEFTNSGNQQVTVSGRIWPAAAGRPVSLYSGVAPNGDGGTWQAGTTTDGAGRFSFTMTVGAVTRFKFFSASQVIGATTYRYASSAPFDVKSLRVWDGFDYANLTAMQQAGKWAVRQPDFQPPSGDPNRPGRQYSRGDWGAVEPTGTTLKLKVLPAPEAPGTPGNPADPANPRKFITGHITTGTLPFTYGHIEARIRFQRPRGASGGLWWQSGYDTSQGQAEFDAVEFFGQNGADGTDQKVQHTIHQGTDQYWSNTWGTNAAMNPAWDTWWTSFHTFEGIWTSAGYQVRIDGDLRGIIPTAYVGTAHGEGILSLLVNNAQAATLNSDYPTTEALAGHVMEVDWFRVWR